MSSQAALYPGSLVGAAAAAGICGGLLLGFVAGLLSMAPISRLLAKSRRRSRRRRETWQLPFGQKEKVDVLPVFDEQAQVSPHEHFQAHGRVPSNMPSTPTLTDGAPHSRKGTLVERAGMSHPSPSMEYVSSPAVTARSTSRSAHESPINFSLPSQSLRDPYSLRRPPTAVRKGSADSVQSSPSRPVYNLFTRRPSSHSRQPSYEDSHRFAPQPLSHPATPQQRVPHHHTARSDDSSIMALYAAAQQIAEVQGGSSTGSRRPSFSRGTPHQRQPQAPAPGPAMADVLVQPARSHLREGKPALSRLSERTNERSMTLDDTSHTTSSSSPTGSSLTTSLPKRGVLPAEPPGPSWDAGTLQARGRAQVSSSSYDPNDAHLATLRKLVSAIHEHDGVATAHQLGSRFSPDTPWVRRTPGGSPAVVGSYFERDGGAGPGNESHEAQVEEPSVQRFSAESPVIPRNSQVMYIDSSLESRSPPTSPVRSSQISGGGGVAPAASPRRKAIECSSHQRRRQRGRGWVVHPLALPLALGLALGLGHNTNA
ncbi:hypothetical protein BDZ90DRAFT_228077 [Jaminaea rosea]|uniref:Uncharacterized protein n=1 Tax=Jaminaea rosea TaxID=1569628 RepID=A0A316UQG8_9BASI|nr:hypothetical protein BDZ90DRAFT_228077 [Jaminaea rosea]PWN26113.1 hypothetical protein BDZ90DRAFT_228077 [Jaminaea rosea]